MDVMKDFLVKRLLMSYQMKDMAERTNPKGADGRTYLKESKDGVSYSLHCVDVETFPDKVTLGKLHNDRWQSLLQPGRRKCRREWG